MELKSESKDDVINTVESHLRNREDLTSTEKKLLKNEIVSFLNTNRELLPNEERIIKKVAKQYNIFNTILVSVVALAAGGLISFFSYNFDKYIENFRTEQKLDSQAKNLKTEQETSKAIETGIEKALSDSKKKMDDYKDYALGSMANLSKNTTDISNDLLMNVGRVETSKNKVDKLNDELDKQKKRAEDSITQLGSLTNAIQKQDSLAKKYDWLFDMLENRNASQLKVESNENQNYFHIGELLVVWGKRRMKNSDWEKVEFPQKFASDKNLGITVIPEQSNTKNPPYPIVRKLSRDGVEVRLTRRNSKNFKKKYIAEYKPFYYIAIGSAAKTAPAVTQK